jgi:hypothetical protein
MCINDDVKIYHETNFIMNFDGCSKCNPILAYTHNIIYCLGQDFWSLQFIYRKEKQYIILSEYTGLIFGHKPTVS